MKTIPRLMCTLPGGGLVDGWGELGHCYDTGYQQEPCQSGHDLTIYNGHKPAPAPAPGRGRDGEISLHHFPRSRP